jgi:hypothetical protein
MDFIQLAKDLVPIAVSCEQSNHCCGSVKDENYFLNSEATIIFLRMTLLYGGNH